MSTNKLPPQNDAELKTALDELFKEWKGAVSFGDNFVEDGTLPGYYDQRLKILFIGWESYKCEGSKLLDEDYFLSSRSGIHTTQIAYGILNRIEEWQQVVREKFWGGTSYAFMNASKFANLTGKGAEPSKNLMDYINESEGGNKCGRNFTREEIDILNPDLIVTWNLGGFCAEPSSDEKFSDDLTIWTYKSSSGRKIPILSTWHFSAQGKKIKEEIYNPIRDAVKKLIAQGKLKVKNS